MIKFEAIYYNEELKKRYLNEKDKFVSVSVDYIDVQFRKAAKYEIELDKDISNWTVYEIIEYYKLLNVTSFESLMCINSTFSQYTQFCLENSLVKDNQNHYLECTPQFISGCINKAILDKKIIDENIIHDWVDQLPNPKDQFILLSLFEFGKSKDFKDIVYARPTDVDGNKLKLSDRTVDISDKLIKIIENCVEEKVYVSMSGKGIKKMILIDNGYIVKNYPNQNIYSSDFQKGRNIYIICQRIFDYLEVGEWMSPNAIAESGKLNMIKKRASELNMSIKDYIYSDHIKEVEHQYNFIMYPSVYMKKYKEYLV